MINKYQCKICETIFFLEMPLTFPYCPHCGKVGHCFELENKRDQSERKSWKTIS